MKRILLLAVFVLGSASSAAAQADAFANAEVILQRTGIALSGGNPLPGASSTLGIRLGALPKVSVAARLTAARLVIPDEETTDPSDELSSIARSLNVDASVGIFSGFSVLPTV
ncbi:MAG TPA: hypothetical protein VGD27_18060, partial [Longimicrobiales bacterium]